MRFKIACACTRTNSSSDSMSNTARAASTIRNVITAATTRLVNV